MYIAMNRFKVLKERTDAFEQRWLNRDSELHTVAGFIEFSLLRGPEHDDYILYASHTVWQDEAAFEAWTRSEAFRRAHANAGHQDGGPMTLGHPEFEGFTALQVLGQ